MLKIKLTQGIQRVMAAKQKRKHEREEMRAKEEERVEKRRERNNPEF